MSNQISIRYCSKCGSVMVFSLDNKHRYDVYTGKPIYKARYYCPLGRHWFDGHDVIRGELFEDTGSFIEFSDY